MLLASLTLYLLAAIILCLYFYSTRKFRFWKQLGVPQVSALPFIGSLKDIVFLKTSIADYLKKIYDVHKDERYVGIFVFDEPAIVLRDLDIAKTILVKDFWHFATHVMTTDTEMDPLGARNIFMMREHNWKHMRNWLSPTFTSGKMKNMFFLVEKCAQELENQLDTATAGGSPVEVKYIAGKYTIDSIASCAFGIDSNSLKDPNAEFTVKLNKAFQFDNFRVFKSIFLIFKPKLLKLLRMKLFDPDFYDFVRRTVWDTMNYRERHGILRNDFLDNLRDIRRKVESSSNDDDSVPKLDDDDYAAQALSFLLAGFETSSSTISFSLYELALNPEVQNRLREEMKEVLKKHNNQVTYEAIPEMKYLDMVVNETLRKYPPVPFIDRRCTADYEFPAPSGRGTITIPAGTGVYIPLLGIHYDPEFYPQPNKFDPERFTDENKQKRPNNAHIPFGEGPRICIGMRFGMMQTKTGLIHILSRYEVAPCKETKIPLVFDKKAFMLQSEGGIMLSFKRIT